MFKIPVEATHLASCLKSFMQKLPCVPHDVRCVVPNKKRFQAWERFRLRCAVGLFYFLQGVVFSSWASRIPDVKTSLALSDAQLGGMLFAIPLGQLVMMPVSGALVSRFGSRICLAFALVCYSMTLFLCGLVAQFGTPHMLFAGLFLWGCAGNLNNISVNTQGVGVERIYERSIMATFHGLWSLAGFLAGLGSSFLVKFGILPQEHFAGVAVLCFVLLAIFIRRTISSDGAKQGKIRAAGNDVSDSRAHKKIALADPFILLLGVLAGVCMGCEGVMYDWSAVYFADVVKPDESLVRLGYTASMFAMSSGRFVADFFITRFGQIRIIQVCSLLITSGLGLAIAFPNLACATLGFLLVGFGVSAVVPICYSLSGRANGIPVGKALAAVSTVGFLGFLLGPPVIGFISEQLGSLRWAFLVVAIFAAGSAALAPRLRKFITP